MSSKQAPAPKSPVVERGLRSFPILGLLFRARVWSLIFSHEKKSLFSSWDEIFFSMAGSPFLSKPSPENEGVNPPLPSSVKLIFKLSEVVIINLQQFQG